LSWLCLAAEVSGQSLTALQKSLSGWEAAIVIRELRTGGFLRLNEARLSQEFPPFHTLEVPVALAALDARTVRHLNEVTPWNRLAYPLPENAAANDTQWTEDHTLRSAFIGSVPWYWQGVSERLGAVRLTAYLRKFAYGNQQLPADLVQCWQDNALTISANAQADFLTALVNESLPISKFQQRQLKPLLLRESGAGYRYYLKTGTGYLQNGKYLGWSIGWLETSAGVYVFALNLTHHLPETARAAILSLPKEVLAAAGYWTAVME
jgi:beta-lactamase class D